MVSVSTDGEEPGDAALIKDVREGTMSAYGILYERHVTAAYSLARRLVSSSAEADDLVSEAFVNVLDVLRAGRGPDSAFRAYLLTALRHIAYDKARHDRKVDLFDDIPEAAISEDFNDSPLADLERSLAAHAFSRLRERWQAILWCTEVEGRSPQEIAPIFGLTPGAVSALAYRAREGFRMAYLRAHLANISDPRCQAIAEKLGVWIRGDRAIRERAQIEKHLDMCERCRDLAAELADVNGSLRTFVPPVVLGDGTAGYFAANAARSVAAKATAATSRGSGPFVRAAAAAALAIAVLRVMADGGDHPPPRPPTTTTTAVDNSMYDIHLPYA